MTLVTERKIPQTSGVLFKQKSFQHITLRQFVPRKKVALPWLDHLWLVTWDMPRGETYEQKTLPYPTCHMVLDPQQNSGLFGCSTGRFDYCLSGKGAVIGARLQPGAFRAFSSLSAHQLLASHIPLHQLLPTDAQIPPGPFTDHTVDLFTGLLAQAARPLPADASLVRTIVETIRTNDNLYRVAQLEILINCSTRKLQRLFREFIGVTPKWAIDRFRMLEAVESLAQDQRINLADLAARLGYTDQAHFSRAFKTITGVPPGKYAVI